MRCCVNDESNEIEEFVWKAEDLTKIKMFLLVVRKATPLFAHDLLEVNL